MRRHDRYVALQARDVLKAQSGALARTDDVGLEKPGSSGLCSWVFVGSLDFLQSFQNGGVQTLTFGWCASIWRIFLRSPNRHLRLLVTLTDGSSSLPIQLVDQRRFLLFSHDMRILLL